MARTNTGVGKLTRAEQVQLLQTLITAATGNANVPTPIPTIPAMQTLVDDGTTKTNALEASKAHSIMLRAELNAHMKNVRLGITQFITYAEAACGFNPVKLQSLGLTLRKAATPLGSCGTVMGLVAKVGDYEGQMQGLWPRLPFAEAYEVQTSPDPINASSWVSSLMVIDPEVTLTGLIIGQKRWLRVRAINRISQGAWSDPACRMIP